MAIDFINQYFCCKNRNYVTLDLRVLLKKQSCYLSLCCIYVNLSMFGLIFSKHLLVRLFFVFSSILILCGLKIFIVFGLISAIYSS